MATKVKAKVKAKAVETKEAGAPRTGTIKALACDLILKNQSSEQIIAAVQKEFPDSAFGPTHVAFYKNKLKKEGHEIAPAPRGKKKSEDGASAKPNAKASTAPSKAKAKAKAARTGLK